MIDRTGTPGSWTSGSPGSPKDQGDDRHGRHDRDARVHVARAGRGQGGRRAVGHLLAGRHPLRDGDGPGPVRGRDAAQRGHEAQDRDAPGPPGAEPQISPALSRIILKCLAKAKEDRFQTAAELGMELEALEKGFPTPERAIVRKRPTSTREVTIKFEPRRLIIPALGVLIVAGAFFVGRSLTKKPAAEPPRTAEDQNVAGRSGARGGPGHVGHEAPRSPLRGSGQGHGPEGVREDPEDASPPSRRRAPRACP